jgi:hypothetical protein
MTTYHPDYPYFKSHCHCCKAHVEKVIKVELECPPTPEGLNRPKFHYVPTVVECKCKKCVGHK